MCDSCKHGAFLFFCLILGEVWASDNACSQFWSLSQLLCKMALEGWLPFLGTECTMGGRRIWEQSQQPQHSGAEPEPWGAHHAQKMVWINLWKVPLLLGRCGELARGCEELLGKLWIVPKSTDRETLACLVHLPGCLIALRRSVRDGTAWASGLIPIPEEWLVEKDWYIRDTYQDLCNSGEMQHLRAAAVVVPGTTPSICPVESFLKNPRTTSPQTG